VLIDRLRLVFVTLSLAVWVTFPTRVDGAPQLAPAGLRCEYLTHPLGIDEPAPRLTWTCESDRRGDVQTRYRVLVASSPQLLERGEGDLWDSGEVASSAMQVVYAGKPLASRQVCYWRVRVWDQDGASSAGPIARWEMGLLDPRDWTASWIAAGGTPVKVGVTKATYSAIDGSVHKDVTKEVAALVDRLAPVIAKNEALGGDPAVDKPKRLSIEYSYRGATLATSVPEGAAPVLPTERAAYLRRSFTSAKPVAKARLYATALGLYELHLNGMKVGRDGGEWLAPGWTDYRKRVQYQVHDVTAQVKDGNNLLSAIVAPGWFSGRAGLFHARRFYGVEPALLAQLEITYTDGSVERIGTDTRWQRHDGPILLADMMDGEMYDARDEFRWEVPDGWAPVIVRTEARKLVAQMDDPVRALREVAARSVTEAPDAPGAGRWIFDLGENMVGVVRLRVKADAGTVLTIRHAEMLKPDGGIYTDNLRGAAATDVYICRGGGEEVWNPRFTLHGFRYVEVAGLKAKPGVEAVTGIVLGSAMPDAGTFSCSDERLNKLQANIVRGLRGNYVSIPTDCPQRDERMGWMADTQVFVPTAVYNADVAPFMAKWMDDVVDAQRDDGAHSDVAPVMKGLTYGTPAWADAGTIVPWTIYEMYGDTRILERNIDSMMRWVDWCRERSTGLIRDRDRGNDYGDWLAIGADTPKDLIGTAYFAHSADIVARSLGALGRKGDAQRYAKLAADVRSAFVAKYVGADGRITGNTQCGYLLALRFGLLPEELRPAAVKYLLADIESRGYRLSTGFVGVGLLLPALAEAGEDAAAYRLLLQDEFPSWLFSVKHGATTIWERWDGWTPERGVHPDASMNSFNHYSLGSCGQWLFEGVAGIEPDPEKPGFEHFFIRPRTAGPLNAAWAIYRSIRGDIRSAWQVEGIHLRLSVTVPGNTSATVVVPSRANTAVIESGRGLQGSPGVRSVKREGDSMIIEVGGGTYEFTSTHPVVRAANPIASGWYADPDAVKFGDAYWIYPTTSKKYDEQLAFDAFTSTDLVRWTKHADVLKASDVAWAKRAMWAPAAIKHRDKYFLFFAANDIQKDGEVGGIGVAVGERPWGPFVDYLGKPLLDAFHNGAQPIDQCVFKDTDGRFYLLYGGWGHCNIAQLRDDFRGFEPFKDGATFKEITPEGYVEGPYMLERGGKYYFMWSEGGWTGPDYSVAYAIGDSPLGPFKRVGKILQQDPAIATGAGHHSVLHVPGTDEWFIVYHRRPLGETDGNHRVVCIDRLTFAPDGTIEPVKMTVEGVTPVARPKQP
jgi:alpha-L-rhamnosidase